MPLNAGAAQATFQPPPLNDQVLGTPLTNRSKAPGELSEGRASFSWSGWFTQIYWRFSYLRLSVRAVTGSTTISLQDSTVIASIQAIAFFTLLDATAVSGQILTFKNDKWSSENIVLLSSQNQTVDRAQAATVILMPGDSLTIQSDGTNWIILSRFVSP